MYFDIQLLQLNQNTPLFNLREPAPISLYFQE